jgi:hypothetical protein
MADRSTLMMLKHFLHLAWTWGLACALALNSFQTIISLVLIINSKTKQELNGGLLVSVRFGGVELISLKRGKGVKKRGQKGVKSSFDLI